jgi:hypothetical protein
VRWSAPAGHIRGLVTRKMTVNEFVPRKTVTILARRTHRAVLSLALVSSVLDQNKSHADSGHLQHGFGHKIILQIREENLSEEKETMKFTAATSLLALVGTHGFLQQSSTSVRLSATELWARKPFITGNWKLNPQTKKEAIELARGVAASVTLNSPCDVGIFVPFPFLECVMAEVGDKLVVGAEVRDHFVVKIQIAGAPNPLT